MKKLNKILSKYGLDEKEAKIYLTCLKHGELTPYRIAKLTKIPRSTVYDNLMHLALKKLVSLQKSDGFTKQQTLVRASNPSKIREGIRKSRKELAELEIDFLEALPTLKDEYHKKKSHADFKFYPGTEGARKVYYYEDMPKSDEDLVGWDMVTPADALNVKEINKDAIDLLEWAKNRGVPMREIVPMNNWVRDVLAHHHSNSNDFHKYWKYRYIDNSLFNMSLRLAIHGERIRVVCTKEEENWGLVIKSKAFSTSLKSLFEIEWERAKPITKEMLDSWKANSDFEDGFIGRKKQEKKS